MSVVLKLSFAFLDDMTFKTSSVYNYKHSHYFMSSIKLIVRHDFVDKGCYITILIVILPREIEYMCLIEYEHHPQPVNSCLALVKLGIY